MRRRVLWWMLLALACAAPAAAAVRPEAPPSAEGVVPLRPSQPPEWTIPPGWEPEAIRTRLATVDGAEVSRACGNLESPWAYRGKPGRRLALRDYGRRPASPEQARRLAAMLRESPVDTIYLAPGAVLACEAAHAPPVYLVRFSGTERPTFALLRFDIAAIELFDSELPLGLIPMGDRADSLWAALAELFDDDPAFRAPRPAPGALRGRGTDRDTTSAGVRPDYVFVAELPAVLDRAAPVYPEEARRMLIQGTVHVQALVGADGLVRDALVRAGPPALRDAALDAIWQWRFQPAMDRGRPVAVWVLIPVKFTLH